MMKEDKFEKLLKEKKKQADEAIERIRDANREFDRKIAEILRNR